MGSTLHMSGRTTHRDRAELPFGVVQLQTKGEQLGGWTIKILVASQDIFLLGEAFVRLPIGL
jgi:hypothetical protein